MDITKPLPTTTMAVDADLRARADFRGVDEAGQVHYLLGMCEALLAMANADIARLMAASRIASTDRVCENCTHDWRGGPECPVCDHITPDEDPRERGDDDGREYADPRDERDERL